jgi:hypothetical protein
MKEPKLTIDAGVYLHRLNEYAKTWEFIAEFPVWYLADETAHALSSKLKRIYRVADSRSVRGPGGKVAYYYFKNGREVVRDPARKLIKEGAPS